MNHKTHSIAGLVAAEATLLHFQHPPISWVTPTALLGGYVIALLCDVDKPSSKMGRHLWLVSRTSSMLQIRHRTLAHSLLASLLIWVVLFAAPIPDVLAWSLFFSFCSHWFIDLFNESGVELLWPIPIKFKLLPGFLAISSEDLIGQRLFRLALTILHMFLLLSIFRELLFAIPLLGSWLRVLWGTTVDLIPEFLRAWLF